MCATLWLLATNRIEGNSLTTVIPVMSADVRQPTTIIIRRASGSLTSRSNLDGFAGLMHRARAAYDQLSNDFPSTGAVPDAVTILMQTGNRIGYRPETAKTEISALSTQTSAAVAATTALENEAATERKPGTTEMVSASADRAAQHKARVDRALANLKSAP